MSIQSNTTTRYDARFLLLIVLAISFVVTWIPFGEFVVYPFRLFGTFIHEAAHALAAVLTGGRVIGMHVNWDTSGLTTSAGGIRPIISSAGYLGTVFVGALLLMIARRAHRAPMAMMVLGASVILTTVAFGGYGFAIVPLVGIGVAMVSLLMARRQKTVGAKEKPWVAVGLIATLATLVYLFAVGGLLTWSIGLLVGVGAFLVGAFSRRVIAHGALLFLAVQTSLDGLWSMRNLIYNIDHSHSDAVSMAQMTGIPAIVWASLWAALGAITLLVALWVFWSDSRLKRRPLKN